MAKAWASNDPEVTDLHLEWQGMGVQVLAEHVRPPEVRRQPGPAA